MSDTGLVMAKVTLQSVADEVGVSRMTVSNAFSRPDQLSKELRERILATAETLGYSGPDPAARALARGRTGAVGLLLNGPLSEAFEDDVSAEFVAAVADELTRRGLALTVLTPPQGDRFLPARDVAVDGALVYTCDPTSAGVAWLSRRKLPVVAVDQDLGREVTTIGVDDLSGARAGARHLLELGHRRIGVLALTEQFAHDPPNRDRLLGWRRALGEHGLEPVVARTTLLPRSAAFAAATDLLESSDVTAVLCFDDVFARAVIAAATALGRSVPGDLSVVGYDDSRAATVGVPALTTVRQDVTAKGHLAAGAIADLLDGRAARSHVLPTELVVRDSTGPVPAP
ncbi:LacI family DNA-binding transcriptional regulator [Promicromonospora iranensis]|uniref:LacI family DNA-binding transcriptional regulator n=2 Tax=Promicromonospora iranensis TaxID=1105144 RepID=UPI00286C32C7|nr:LacI family DNA-binding transcriptional regulator [Promicromonospora iranensis]